MPKNLSNLNVIVPIAGPDYFSAKGIKGLFNTSNGPLLKNVLTSRPWFNIKNSENYIFVMKESKQALNFYHRSLKIWFPKCKSVFLSDFTKGAAISALMGIGYCIDGEDSPFIIDLADIKFQVNNQDFNNLFREKEIDAYIYTFNSNNINYSYAKVNDKDLIYEIAEKKVISSNAITGVYLFRSPSIFLESIKNSLEDFKKINYNGLLYISPLLNTLFEKDIQIKIIRTTLKEDFSSRFNY